MNRLLGALAFAMVSTAAAAQQFNAPLTPGVVAVTPTGPLSFTPARVVNPVDFGAKCDGVNDDTAALQAAIATLGSKSTFHVPGVCVFKSPLVFPTYSFELSITGNGYGSQLIYKGASAAGDLITIGTPNDTTHGNCSTVRLSIRDVAFASSLIMTSGDAIKINDACDSTISSIIVGGTFGQTGDAVGNNNFFNGLHLNGGNSIHMRGFFGTAGGAAALLVNGDVASPFTDLYFVHGKVVRSMVGLQIAGNVGGVTVDQTEFLSNGTHVSIDQSQVAVANAAEFFGPGVAIDLNAGMPSGGAGIGVSITDPGMTSGGQSWLVFSGTWLASSTNQCMEVASGSSWNINYTGGVILNCGGGGIKNESDTGVINVTGTRFWNNSGWDIYNGNPANHSITASAIWSNSGNFNSGAGGIISNGRIAGRSIWTQAQANAILAANAGYTAIFGSGTDSTYCGLGANSLGYITPYKMNASSPGCALDLGTSSYPFGSLYSSATVAGGSPPTNGGTCAINTQVGGNTAGSFRFNGACSSGTIVLTFSTTAPNGWVCDVQDMTTSSTAIRRTGYSTTTATLAVSGAASADQTTFKCTGM